MNLITRFTGADPLANGPQNAYVGCLVNIARKRIHLILFNLLDTTKFDLTPSKVARSTKKRCSNSRKSAYALCHSLVAEQGFAVFGEHTTIVRTIRARARLALIRVV